MKAINITREDWQSDLKFAECLLNVLKTEMNANSYILFVELILDDIRSMQSHSSKEVGE